jgi:O-antigen/teichoic acid export membrane protein
LHLLGEDYAEGSLSLEIMLLSMLPTAVQYGITSLAFSYANYRQVLFTGLSTSVPRVVLYFVLVPVYGGTGASIAYTLGAIIGFVTSVIIAKEIGLEISWRNLFYIFIIPVAISAILANLQVIYLVAIPSALLISYIIFLKLGIMSRLDIRDSINILPKKISQPLISILESVERKINRQF